MRKPLLAAAAVLAGPLLIAPTAHARGGSAGGAIGFRGAAALGFRGAAARGARGLRAHGPGAAAPDERAGELRGAGNERALAGSLAPGPRTGRVGLPGFAIPPMAPFGFGYRTSFGGYGRTSFGGYSRASFGGYGRAASGGYGGDGRRRSGFGLPYGFGWGELGAGWWATGWDFPWNWQGFDGPCYQWIYPPAAPPYCAPPYPGPY